MKLHRKALYNLIQLQISTLNDAEPFQLEPWQRENYRTLSLESLLSELHHLNFNWTREDFESYAKSFDSPEELAENLTSSLSGPESDRVFLLIFELWRRLSPEKQSISIFCDELDHQIILYDLDQSDNPTDIQDALAYLQLILDENVDKGVKPTVAFEQIQTYCANNLETFLYDYILDQIEEGYPSYGRELVEGFYRYVQEPIWFDYLLVRCEVSENPEEGYPKLEALVARSGKYPVDLNLEILDFLVDRNTHNLFVATAYKTLPALETEEHFQEFLTLCQAHFAFLSYDELAEKMAAMLEQRSSKDPKALLGPTDPELPELQKILKTEKSR